MEALRALCHPRQEPLVLQVKGEMEGNADGSEAWRHRDERGREKELLSLGEQALEEGGCPDSWV